MRAKLRPGQSTRYSIDYRMLRGAPNLRRLLFVGALLGGQSLALSARAYDKVEGRPFHDAYNACEALVREGSKPERFAGGRACLTPLIAKAKRAGTKADLAYRSAEWLERQGAYAPARDAFLDVVRAYPREAMAARARFRAARLLEDRLNNPEAADMEYRALVREAPDSVAALNALVHIEERVREHQGDLALISYYDSEISARPKSHLAPVLLERLGHAALGSAKSAERAVRVFDVLAKRKGAKLDDALFYGAKARLLIGDSTGAVAALEALLDTRERTPIPGKLVPGELHSSKMDDARYLLGEIMRDRTRDLVRARFHFQTLLEESPDSRLVDDALNALAGLALAAGDRAAAARHYAELLNRRPGSRFAKLAREFRP